MEKIIIDNVDVSDCEYFEKDIADGCCTNPTLECSICKDQDCNYKKVKTLEEENELLQKLKDEDSLRVVALATENQRLKKNYEHLIAYIKEDLVPYTKELEHSLEKIRIIAMPECPYFERAKTELHKIVNEALEG